MTFQVFFVEMVGAISSEGCLVNHAHSSRTGWLDFHYRLSICPHDMSTTDAARITKLHVEMFHDESWKLIYFGVKRSKVKVTSYRNIDGVGLCTLANAGFFYLLVLFQLS